MSAREKLESRLKSRIAGDARRSAIFLGECMKDADAYARSELAPSPFNARELATVLAALQFWQRAIKDGIDVIPAKAALGDLFEGDAGGWRKIVDIAEQAEEGRELVMMPGEITNLCERLNVTPGDWAYKAPEELTAAKITDIMAQEFEACVGPTHTPGFKVFAEAVARDIRHQLGLPS